MPKERAGGLIALYELCATLGVFLAYVVYLMLSEVEHAWRQMFFCGIMFPAMQVGFGGIEIGRRTLTELSPNSHRTLTKGWPKAGPRLASG